MADIEYLGPLGQADLEPIAEKIAIAKGIPTHIFKGLIDHESSWDVYARNPESSAKGLGQHLDETASTQGLPIVERGIGNKTRINPNDPRYNPKTSLEYAADHLLAKYKETGDWRKAVMSYGEGTESYVNKAARSIMKFFSPGEAQAADIKENMPKVEYLGPVEPSVQGSQSRAEFIGPTNKTESTSREDDYDYKSAAIAGYKPDKTGHWPSRVGSGEQEGLILKSETHPTFDKTILGEAAAGNVFYRNKKDGKLYSFPPDAKLSADFEKETKYQPIIDKIQEDLSKELEIAVMAGAPEAALAKPETPSVGPEIARIVAPYARPALELGGLAAGGIVGGAGGWPTGGVASVPGAIAGAGLGYSLGRQAAGALETYAGTKSPTGVVPAMVEAAKDVVTGAAMEMGGAVGGKVLQKGLEVGGKIAKPVLGRISGLGIGHVEEALKGGENFIKGLKGKLSGEEIVDAFRNSVQKIKDIRGADYQKALTNIASKDTGVRTIGKPYEGVQIDLKPINLELRKLMESYRIKVTPEGELDFSHMAIGERGRKDVVKMIETVWNWKDNTPLGIDALKRYLGDFYSESSQARSFTSSLYKSVKDTLTKAIPEYAEMTKGYSEASKVIEAIEKGLMLKQSGRVGGDQILRRLISSMKDNSEMRKDLVRVLGEGASEDLQGLLAGYAGRAVLPVGMAGSPLVLIGEIAIARFFNPKFWPILAVSSPRIQSEFLSMYGKALRETSGASLPVAKMVSYLALARKEAREPENQKKEEIESRQFGGPVGADQPVMVGEAGPELFVPDDPRKPRIVGQQGPQVITPGQPGMVIPESTAWKDVKNVQSWRNPNIEPDNRPIPSVIGDFSPLDVVKAYAIIDLISKNPKLGLSLREGDIEFSLSDLQEALNKIKGLPSRAEGGPVEGGKPVLVGEKGPELLIPAGGDMGPWNPSKPEGFKTWKDRRAAELSGRVPGFEVDGGVPTPGTGPLDVPDRWLWLDLEKTKHSDYYNKDMVQKFAAAAKKYGVDPYDFIALGISETGLGNQDPRNPSKINPAEHEKTIRKLYSNVDSENWGDIGIDYGARYLAEQQKKYPKNKLAALQAYSGTGSKLYKKTPWVDAPPESRWFGKPLKEQDMWKDKPQAKRIVAIAEKLRKNKEFRKYLDSLQQADDEVYQFLGKTRPRAQEARP